MGKHALLSASSSERWLNCPPSARLCERYEDSGSSYAEEGSQAHTLCEYKLKKFIGEPAKNPIKRLSYYNAEMESCADEYVNLVAEAVETMKISCPDPLVLLEQRVDFSEFVKDGFGTADCVIIGEPTMHIIDYKYGAGVAVSAEDNSQLKLYALGALAAFGHLFEIDMVHLSICQPRRDNISTFVISTAELYLWADEVLRPTAEIAYSGGGEFKCGEWCRFCRAKAECRKRAEENMKLAAYDFEIPALLDNDEIADILGKVDELVSWAGDIKEHALIEALNGTKFNGWKIVEGRSNRKYMDEKAAAEAVEGIGLDPYEHKILGITAMTSLLGKKKFAELLDGLIMKPVGKPTLVSVKDKRKEIQIISAADDFADCQPDSGHKK